MHPHQNQKDHDMPTVGSPVIKTRVSQQVIDKKIEHIIIPGALTPNQISN